MEKKDDWRGAVRFVATDMDGTLLDSEKRVPSDFRNWVESHPNIKTAIASGRQYYALERDFSDLKEELIFIAENGSAVYEKGKLLYFNQMKEEDILTSLALISSIEEATAILCGVDSAYMINPGEEEKREAGRYYARLSYISDFASVMKTDRIIKIAVYFRNQSAERHYPEFKALPSSVKTVLSGKSWVDIASFDADKGVGIKEIQKRFSITREESMAFGDYLNDIGMLKAVKYSVAMENAHPQVKAVCTMETSNNDDDGVMRILRQL